MLRSDSKSGSKSGARVPSIPPVSSKQGMDLRDSLIPQASVEKPPSGSYVSIKMVMIIAAVAVPLLFLVITGVYAYSKYTSTNEESAWMQADVLSRFASKHIQSLPAEKWKEFISHAEDNSSCLIGLYNAEGASLSNSRLARAQVPGIRDITEESRTRFFRGSGEYVMTLHSVKTSKQVLRLAVAAPVDIPGFNAYAGLLWIIISALALLSGVILIASYTGRQLAGDLKKILIKSRDMLTPGVTDTVSVRHELIDDETGRLAAALETLQNRFNAELYKYQSALDDLEDEDRIKEEFLSTVSHELRTPLNAIIGFAELLLQKIEGDLTETQEEDIRIIRQGGKHLLEMVEEILDLSAIVSGHVKMESEAFLLVDVVREVINAARSQKQNASVSLELDEDSLQIEVLGDRRRIWQVLTNLVGNAVKFTESGSISVNAQRLKEEIQVCVKDTGPGIPLEDQEEIFKEFQQTGDRKAMRRGTGLGLAISRRLVSLHGGRIWVESEPGEGATFCFTLPGSSEPAAG